MSEVVYEETATMIAAGELQSFVPFGREHCRNHPNAFNLQLRELQPASELWSSDGAAGLVGSLQEVSLQERERVRLHGITWLSQNGTHIPPIWARLFKKHKTAVVHKEKNGKYSSTGFFSIWCVISFNYGSCMMLKSFMSCKVMLIIMLIIITLLLMKVTLIVTCIFD